MPNKVKIQKVDKLLTRLQKTSNYTVVSIGRATHKNLEELRSNLRAINVEGESASLNMLKNSLFRVALDKIKKADMIPGDTLKGASALLSLPTDWMGALKAFYTYSKTNENFGFKVGVIDGKVYIKSELVRLAQLPSREQLVAKILSSFKTLQTRLVRSLNYNTQRLVYILSAKAKQN